MLKKRVITALWGVPLLVAAIWFEEPLPWFTILVAAWGGLAVLEFYRMFNATKTPPLTYFGLVWTLLFIISPHFKYDFITPLLLTSAVVISLVWLVLRQQKEGAFIGWAWTIAGILYIGWLLSYFVALRGLADGRNWVFLAIFTVFAYDTAAFLGGRALGRHRLAPRISPGKTWEGAIIGTFSAAIISLVLAMILKLPLSYGHAVLIGLLISIFAQLGDLAESLLKRNMGVKDSGKSMPGHGGFLDRTDSVVFTGALVYYYVIWVIQ